MKAWRDLTFGWRVFARQPLRTLIAVVSLSLAIGANTAMFSVLNAVILRPFPFPDPDRLVLVVDRLRPGAGSSPTIPETLDVRARSRTLDGVTFFDTRDFQVDGGAEPMRVLGARVAPGFLQLLGARQVRGRLLSDADSADGSPAVILLSDSLWRRNFSADPGIVGRSIVVDGEARTIAGVLAPEFALGFLSGEPPEIYVPYPFTADYILRSNPYAGVRRVTGLARMASGVSQEAVSAELATIASQLAAEHPALYPTAGSAANFVMDAEPLRNSIGGGNRSTILMLFGAVALVLLIGCVNVAQFLLSHAIEREPEVAVRSALGASRGRLVRQFLSETLILAVAAAGLGILQAVWLLDIFRAVLPRIRMVGQIDLDIVVLGFAIVVGMGTMLLCGVVPGLRFSRVPLRSTFDPRVSTGGGGRARQILVAVQVALSIVLLIQAALLTRTLQSLQRSQSGFSDDAVTTMRMRGMTAGAALGRTYAQFLERIALTPGVAAAAVTSSTLPGRPGTPFSIIGRSTERDASARSRQVASYQIVSPEYFSVLGIPMRQGRTFSPLDTAEATPVAIINEEMARLYWPGESPIGRQIRAGSGPREATMTVVGIVGNVRTMLQRDDAPQIYVSYLQQPEPNGILLVRPASGHAAPIEAIKRAIWSVEPRQALFGIRPLDELVLQSVQTQRFVAVLIASFAALALVMSMAGVFSVVSYLTSRRHKEIAVRRAVGAANSDVLWLLSGQTFRWTVAGLIIGVGAGVLASRALRATVTGLADLDFTTVAIPIVGYLMVAGVAMMVPALRALRIDPASALRAE
jgi:putative ABC transport system permease protein